MPWSDSYHDVQFSANHLTLLSRRECCSCAVFLVLDHSTHRVCRLYDFTKAHAMEPDSYYCVSGKVNSADKLYLVIESVKPDAKHSRSSNAPAPVDGAGGRFGQFDFKQVGKNFDQRRLPESVAAHALVWVGTETGDAWLPLSRWNWLRFNPALTVKQRFC